MTATASPWVRLERLNADIQAREAVRNSIAAYATALPASAGLPVVTARPVVVDVSPLPALPA